MLSDWASLKFCRLVEGLRVNENTRLLCRESKNQELPLRLPLISNWPNQNQINFVQQYTQILSIQIYGNKHKT